MQNQTFFFGLLVASVFLVDVNESTASDPIEIALKPIGTDDVYVGHRDFVAITIHVTSYQDSVNVRFTKVDGLADPKAISFRSLSDPEHYLRNRNGRLVLTRCANELDKKEASFYPVESSIRNAKGAVSLESQIHPGHYLRRKGTEFWVEKKEDNDAYRTDATFLLAAPPAFKAVNLPTGEWGLRAAPVKAEPWRYTFDKPNGNWEQPGFDDSGWKQGFGGFGTWGPPQAIVRTIWNTSDIWLRRSATLPAKRIADVVFWLHHDDDAEIYVNGVLAATANGYRTAYDYFPMSPAARAAVRAGDNVIAVHCRQTGGGQFIDVGLVEYPYFELPITTGVEVNKKLHIFATETRELMRAHLVPCGTLAIMRGNRIVASYGIGFADQAKTKPIKPDALLRTASVDKPIMKATVAVLEGERRRCPDGSVFSRRTRVYPLLESYGVSLAKVQNIDPRIRQIRVEDLIEMRSGLPLDGGPAEPIENPDSYLPDLAIWAAGQPLRYEPGKAPKPEYSNLNFSLMKLLLHKLTGNLAVYYRDKVLGPAGSRDVALARSRPSDRNPREPWYYSPFFSRNCETPIPESYVSVTDTGLDGRLGSVVSAEALVRFMRRYHLFRGVLLINPRTNRWAPPDTGFWCWDGSIEGTFVSACQFLDRQISVAAMFNKRGSGDAAIQEKLIDLVKTLPDSAWTIQR